MKIKAKNPKVFDHAEKGKVLAYLNSNAQDNDVSFDELRASLSVDKEKLPDGVIHQIAIDAGYEVQG